MLPGHPSPLSLALWIPGDSCKQCGLVSFFSAFHFIFWRAQRGDKQKAADVDLGHGVFIP